MASGDYLVVNGAKVITPNIVASNGVIHVIDSVLLPKLPEPTPTDRAKKLIELAINRGVPLFNDGNAAMVISGPCLTAIASNPTARTPAAPLSTSA